MDKITYSNGKHIWLIKDIWKAAKGLPVIHKPIKELEWVLDDYCWTFSMNDNSLNDKWFKTTCGCHVLPLTVKDIINHIIRINSSKLSIYPIILNKDGHVLDGVHRLAYAYLNNWKKIPVQIIKQMPEPYI